MVIEEAINSILRDNSALTRKVGSRIRPFAFTQIDKTPCIAYQIVSREPFEHMSGQADYTRVTIQVDVWADSYAKCNEVANLIKSTINNYHDEIEDIEIVFAKYKDESDLSELPDVGQQLATYRLSQTYLIMYRNT